MRFRNCASSGVRVVVGSVGSVGPVSCLAALRVLVAWILAGVVIAEKAPTYGMGAEKTGAAT